MTSSAPSTPTSSSQEALKPLLEAIESSKDANLMTIRSLVLKIFSEPNVFAGYDQVKVMLAPALNGPEGEKMAKTLDLFSYGTFTDYCKDTTQFLPLQDSQIFKLRQLTVMTTVQKFAFAKTRIIPYQEFQQALGLETGRQVEEVLISCIYAGVFGAKLCQKTNSLKLDPKAAAGALQTRDVPATAVPHMMEQLQAMRNALQQSQQAMQNNNQAVARELEQYQAFLKQAQQKAKAEGGGGTRGGAGGWDAEGLVGDITAAVRRQKRSRGGGVSGMPDNSFGRFHL